MARKTFKCRFCKEQILQIGDIHKETTVYESGRKLNKYYHKDCFKKELKAKEKTATELEEKSKLNDTVKRIHNLKADLPTLFWHRVQDARSGKFTNMKRQKSKGSEIPYHILEKAYIKAESSIRYAIMNKRFSSVLDEVKYCFAIALNKVNDVYKEEESKRMQKEFVEAKGNISIETKATAYKKVQKNLDLESLGLVED